MRHIWEERREREKERKSVHPFAWELPLRVVTPIPGHATWRLMLSVTHIKYIKLQTAMENSVQETAARKYTNPFKLATNCGYYSHHSYSLAKVASWGML